MRALVLLALFDLRRHVSHSASVALESIDVLVAGETEVSKLQVEVLVEQNVLELQVAVNDSLAMHELESIKNLVGEESTGVLTHSAHKLAKIKEEAALDVLHHEVDEVIDDTGARLDDRASVTKFGHVNDAWVLEVLEYLNFVVDGNDGFLVAAQELFLQNFDSDESLVGDRVVSCDVHLGGVAFSARFQDGILAVELGVLRCIH